MSIIRENFDHEKGVRMMERRFFMLFGLSDKMIAQNICNELSRIYGMISGEIKKETNILVLEAAEKDMPRIIYASLTILSILDKRIVAKECDQFGEQIRSKL